MARKKAKKTRHQRRGRKMGAAGNDTLELFLGAAVGAVGGYVLVSNAKILPNIDVETKSFILGGASYFVPKFMHGNFGTGIGLGMAGAAAISISKGMGFVTGVYAGVTPGNRLSLVGRPAPAGLLGAPGQGLPVLGRVGAASQGPRNFVMGNPGVYAGF